MKLYHMPGACSLADLIVLEWALVPHQVVRMNHETLKAPEYLALNPAGAVPLLRHDGFDLTENVAILGYIADLHPSARLLGDGTARARAEVMRWLGFLNSDVHKAFGPIFTPGRYLPHLAFADQLATAARVRIRGLLRRLDQQLDGRDWLTGERSLADAYLFVITRWSSARQVGLRDFPNLTRFAERMHGDPGVRAALATEEGPGRGTTRGEST